MKAAMKIGLTPCFISLHVLPVARQKRDIGRFILRLKTIVNLRVSVKNLLDNGLDDYALFLQLKTSRRFTLTNIAVVVVSVVVVVGSRQK